MNKHYQTGARERSKGSCLPISVCFVFCIKSYRLLQCRNLSLLSKPQKGCSGAASLYSYLVDNIVSMLLTVAYDRVLCLWLSVLKPTSDVGFGECRPAPGPPHKVGTHSRASTAHTGVTRPPTPCCSLTYHFYNHFGIGLAFWFVTLT